MEHTIEHSVEIYVGLLLLACLVGILTKWIAHVPYTVALTLVGLLIAVLEIGPKIADTGFSRELIFFVMLPPLLFQGALHIELSRLLRHIWPIVIFASVGLLIWGQTKKPTNIRPHSPAGPSLTGRMAKWFRNLLPG